MSKERLNSFPKFLLTFQFSVYGHYGNYCLQIVYILLGWFLFPSLFFFPLDLYSVALTDTVRQRVQNKDLQRQGVKIPHSESSVAQVFLEVFSFSRKELGGKPSPSSGPGRAAESSVRFATADGAVSPQYRPLLGPLRAAGANIHLQRAQPRPGPLQRLQDSCLALPGLKKRIDQLF